MTKTFSYETPVQQEGSHYKEDILKIINHIEMQVRAVEPDALLHTELHKKRLVDSRLESREFEDVRKDVCASFGVKMDEDHVLVIESDVAKEQRAFRAFFVLVDALSKEAFYGEGRVFHAEIFQKICDRLLSKFAPGVDYEMVASDQSEPPRFLTFKGFVSTKEFQELSDSNRIFLETPIMDENGNRVETPNNWFVTGHNLPESGSAKITS